MKVVASIDLHASDRMRAYTIRRLQIDDYDKGFLETLANLTVVGELTQERFEEIFLETDKNPMCHVFVAELEGKIVGTLKMIVEQKFARSGGKVAHIEDVAVVKELQGNGIGKQMVFLAIFETQQLGCYKVILNCAEHNISFYERCGFRRNEVEMRMDLIKEI